MTEASNSTPSPEGLPEDRLDSWKEIAAYLNRDVTTVQRWEKREGMPVHRHLHGRMGSVYASKAELKEWARTRSIRTEQENATSEATTNAPERRRRPLETLLPRRRFLVPIAAAAAALTIGASLWFEEAEHLWRNPIANARIQVITDFDAVEQAATVSRDGHFVAFLSDRDGQMDVWLTQVGSGQFHNLTRGSVPDLVNPSVRTLGFSPDGSLVTFWVRKQNGSGGSEISIWAAPTLGGQPRPYLEGVAEFDWSHDGSRLAYHPPAPGDPLFVSDTGRQSGGRPIFVAAAGLHCHSFHSGRPTMHSSISWKALFRTSSTFGA